MVGGLLDETIHSVYAYGEDTKILGEFNLVTVQNNGRSCQEVLQWTDLGQWCY